MAPTASSTSPANAMRSRCSARTVRTCASLLTGKSQDSGPTALAPYEIVAPMEYEAYQATAEHEATHWWFLSRRELCLLQVRRAATELGFPQRPLTLLDYGCGTGFNLSFLAEYGQVYGAELVAMVPAPYWKAVDFPLLDLAHDTTPYHSRFDILTAFDVLEHIRDDV